jgi:hypothetical protein
MSSRIDVVFIRKSTQAQDDQGQKQNVSRMLQDLGVTVPEDHWFVGTEQRGSTPVTPPERPARARLSL